MCSSCSFEAFVSRPVTRQARRERERRETEQERATRRARGAVGGCGEGLLAGLLRAINKCRCQHPPLDPRLSHVSSSPSRSLADSFSPSSLYPPSSFLRPPSLARTFARRASKLFPSRGTTRQSIQRREKKGSSSLPMYSRAKLYTITSRESHRRRDVGTQK